MPPEQAALNLLRRARNAGASEAIARDVVLRKLAGLYRHMKDDELRSALALAWVLLRRPL